MKAWLTHTGYPVVVVEDMKLSSSGEVSLRVRQERFMISGKSFHAVSLFG
jgi:carbamoylphosphate synthase large subunit